jgi:hypothetical protein
LAKPQAETPQPIASSSAVPMVIGEVCSLCWARPYPDLHAYAALVVCQGCDLSGLLSFDPESIEPAPPQHAMNQVPAPKPQSSAFFTH